MATFDDLALVWGESVNPNPPAGVPTVSVSAWSHITGKCWHRWNTDTDPVPDEVLHAKIVLVNLFWGELTHHITHIRQYNPKTIVVAAPDPSLDLVLAHPDWLNMYHQMAQADVIAGRTEVDCEVYGSLLNKPTVYLPSPIGPTEFFLPYRDLPKDNYILTLDHQFAPPNTVCNVATLAAYQRRFGKEYRIIYVAERDWTREYAKLAGLECEFRGQVPFLDMIELTARARVCVDLYASHSYGRQQVLCGMVGTSVIGSDFNRLTPGIHADIFSPYGNAERINQVLKHDYNKMRYFSKVGLDFGFEASRQRLIDILARWD